MAKKLVGLFDTEDGKLDSTKIVDAIKQSQQEYDEQSDEAED